MANLKFSSLPSQARIARYWHLYLNRLGLPLFALGYVVQAMQGASPAVQINALLCALVLCVLSVASFVWGERSLLNVDITVAATMWVSMLHGMAQVAMWRAADGATILAMSLFWAPVIAIYWSLVFCRYRMVGVVLVGLYYAAIFLIDPMVSQKTGKSLLPSGWFLPLLQGVMLLSVMAVLSKVTAQLRVSEVGWRSAEHRANHDQLTGLLNRSTFSRHFPRFVKISALGQGELSIMVIDFDHFKYINDHYGHPAGDTVLCKGAKVLTSVLRPGDALYRWGGEEFVILLPDTDAATATVVAERLRRKIERHAFSLQRSITVSIGLASLGKGESAEDFFERADSAMLGAKRNGRNRVEMAPSAINPTKPGMRLMAGAGGAMKVTPAPAASGAQASGHLSRAA